MKRVLVFPVAAALLLAAQAWGGGVVAVLSGASGPYKEALEGLQAVLGPVPSATLPSLPDLAGVKVVVTFGSEAALKSYPSSAALVAALLPDPSLDISHGGKVTKVGLPPAAAVLLAKIRALDPKARSLAVLNPNGAYGDYIGALKEAAGAAGLEITVKKMESMADLADQLPGLKGSVQALYAPPDPLLMNPKTFNVIKDFCNGAGIGFFAPVAGLARAGALAGVAPSFREVGRAAAAAAQSYAGGGGPGDWVYAGKADSTANKTVAAQLGVGEAAAKADNTVE